jgi:hypothetical protein
MSIRCAELGAAVNEPQFVRVTAYTYNGYERLPSSVLPIEFSGIPDPIPLPSVTGPTGVDLVQKLVSYSPLCFELTWTDPNLQPVSHWIEVSSALDPTGTVMAVLLSVVTRFTYF